MFQHSVWQHGIVNSVIFVPPKPAEAGVVINIKGIIHFEFRKYKAC